MSNRNNVFDVDFLGTSLAGVFEAIGPETKLKEAHVSISVLTTEDQTRAFVGSIYGNLKGSNEPYVDTIKEIIE